MVYSEFLMSWENARLDVSKLYLLHSQNQVKISIAKPQEENILNY